MGVFNTLNCNSDILSCCSDYGLASFLAMVKRFYNMVLMIAPIVLLIMLVFQLFKMMANPDEKKNVKALANKFIAIFIVFLSPMMINILFNLLSLSFDINFKLSACLNAASEIDNIIKLSNYSYLDDDTSRKKLFTNSNNSTSSDGVLANGFWWPIAKEYNNKVMIRRGYRSDHLGIDISSTTGRIGEIDIIASYDGVVEAAYNDISSKYNNCSGCISKAMHDGYGNYVKIKHNYKGVVIYSYYAHMTQDVRVRKGQTVKAGDVIGKMGSSGNSTGTHLHFEIRYGTSSRDYKSINNPVNYVTFNSYP